jgi:hypothetical protein
MTKHEQPARSRADGGNTQEHQPSLWFRSLFILTTLSSLLVSGAIWFLPIDVVQDWAFQWSRPDDTARLEAISQAEFLCWVLRLIAPLILLEACRSWYDFSRTARWWRDAFQGLNDLIGELADATKADAKATDSHEQPVAWRVRSQTIGLRVLLIAWVGLTVTHLSDALRHRVLDWPYYRFRSGERVLPNISSSNVEVIRYLQQATPANARILVVSDQKLFFLSYYLLPRRLYHKMHPDSEHVIPKENLQRKLATYKLADLDPAFLRDLNPDYILEYFEHPEEVAQFNLADDLQWIAFTRQMHRSPSHVPSYYVRLQRVRPGGTP